MGNVSSATPRESQLVRQWATEDLVDHFSKPQQHLPERLTQRLAPYGQQQQTLQLLRGIQDSLNEAKSQSGTVVIFLARKMACLFWAMRLAGLKIPDGVDIETDRFNLLLEYKDWAERRLLVRDDVLITGDSLRLRTGRLSRNVVTKNIDARAFIDGKNKANIKWRNQVGQGITQVLAEALVPYFTDFPVSVETQRTATEAFGWMKKIDPNWIDVTNHALDGTRAGQFTLSLEKQREENQVVNAVWPHSHAVKLRVFTWEDGGTLRLRIMSKVILRPIARNKLLDFAGLLDLDIQRNKKQLDDLALQVFGYLEYLVAAAIFNSICDAGQDFTRDLAIDFEFLRFVLGKRLAQKFENHIGIALNFLRDLPPRAPEDFGGSLSNGSQFVTMDRPVALGDDVVKLTAEKILSCGRHKRVPFCDLLSSPEDSFSVSLALDVLNDLGLAVPDQSSFTSTSGELIARSYRRGENSPAWKEITAKLDSPTFARLKDTSFLDLDNFGYVRVFGQLEGN